jgi:hypothetical protein
MKISQQQARFPREKEGRTGRGSLCSRAGGLLALSPFHAGGMRAFRCLPNPYQKVKRTRLPARQQEGPGCSREWAGGEA